MRRGYGTCPSQLERLALPAGCFSECLYAGKGVYAWTECLRRRAGGVPLRQEVREVQVVEKRRKRRGEKPTSQGEIECVEGPLWGQHGFTADIDRHLSIATSIAALTSISKEVDEDDI